MTQNVRVPHAVAVALNHSHRCVIGFSREDSNSCVVFDRVSMTELPVLISTLVVAAKNYMDQHVRASASRSAELDAGVQCAQYGLRCLDEAAQACESLVATARQVSTPLISTQLERNLIGVPPLQRPTFVFKKSEKDVDTT